MAIQNRRGVYSDFTPSKMVPGELAVVQSGDPNNTSGKAVYAAFGSSGDVKRLATEDDLSKKVDKETGKGLSTNDYTTTEKNKLNGIEAQANKTVIDATLTQTGKAADAKAVGDAIAGVTIETDKTLSVTDAPADARVVGDELTDIKNDLSDVNERIGDLTDLETEDKTNIVSAINEATKSGITDAVKEALLACFRHVAFLDDDEDYYKALELALYADDDTGIIPITGLVTGSYAYNNGALKYQGYSYTRMYNQKLVIHAKRGAKYTLSLPMDTYVLSMSLFKTNEIIRDVDAMVTQGVTKTVLSNCTDTIGIGWESSEITLTNDNYNYLLIGVKRSDDAVLTQDDVNAVLSKLTLVEEIDADIPEIPSEYTRWDYIGTKRYEDEPAHYSAINSSYGTVDLYNAKGGKKVLIRTGTYYNVQSLCFKLKCGNVATSRTLVATSDHCVIGASSSGYITNRFGVYISVSTSEHIALMSHGQTTSFPLTIKAVNDVEVINKDTSPTELIVNNSIYEHEWSEYNPINAKIVYFVNDNKQSTDSGDFYGMANLVRVGDLEVSDENGKLLSRLIPVVRNSDNVIGVYDTVNNLFFTAIDVKYATIGNSACIYVVGNWSD